MKYAIIAAGEGSRLATEGVSVAKPLIEIGGEPLLDRLMRIFMDNGADEIVCICNDHSPAVASHLARVQRCGVGGRPVPLRYVVQSTPSSMHSFHAISRYLADGPFVLTTVDTIFREDEFARYVEDFRRAEADGLMGVTRFVDDEKPLWVEMDGGQHITAFRDAPSGEPGWGAVSAGIYGLRPTALATLERCVASGQQRMRNFQRALLTDGLRLEAWTFSKVFDVDHASDISKAEDFVSTVD